MLTPAGKQTPAITAVIGYSEMTLMELEPEHRARAHVEKIRSAGKRAAEVLHRIAGSGLTSHAGWAAR